MNLNTLIILAFFSVSSFAHEGDEEVTVKNNPRFGGRVANVTIEEDHHMGKKGSEHHDEVKFMSEILVSDEGKVRLYFYDLAMKNIDLKGFPEQMNLHVKLPGSLKVILKKQNGVYIGDLPKIKKKPFDLFVDFNANELPLHITFKAMD